MVKQEPTVKLENTEAELKEERVEKKPLPFFDNRVSTITTIVKSESRDTDAPRNAVSVVMAPGMAAAAVTNTKPELKKEEEAERAVVRSNQQAKIPLKKRELKLSDNFHSNHLNNSSSIIVCNPAVMQPKDREHPHTPVAMTTQELTNGRSSVLLPHTEGQNGVVGVIGQVGVVGHIGVIRSPSERHRTPELNGPSVDCHRSTAPEEDRELSRQSVLVRKAPVQEETAALPPPTAQKPSPPVEPEGNSAEDRVTKTTTTEGEGLNKETKSRCQKDANMEETKDRGNADSEKKKSTLGTAEDKDKQEQAAEVNGQTAKETAKETAKTTGIAAGRPKDAGLKSEVKTPLEEASSEIQKEGIRLKIKIPPHRRNKLRGKGAKGGKEEKEQEAPDEGRPLRRSARICRYRPITARLHVQCVNHQSPLV